MPDFINYHYMFVLYLRLKYIDIVSPYCQIVNYIMDVLLMFLNLKSDEIFRFQNINLQINSSQIDIKTLGLNGYFKSSKYIAYISQKRFLALHLRKSTPCEKKNIDENKTLKRSLM